MPALSRGAAVLVELIVGRFASWVRGVLRVLFGGSIGCSRIERNFLGARHELEYHFQELFNASASVHSC
jgi:hypothetical protein